MCFQFQTDWNCYLDFRHTDWARELKMVEGLVSYKAKKSENERKTESKKAADGNFMLTEVGETVEEQQDAPVPLVIQVNNIFHPFFPLFRCASKISN